MPDKAFDFATLIGEKQGARPRRGGRDWRVYCPVHEADGGRHAPSLAVWNRPNGHPAFACMVGCRHAFVREALHNLGVPIPSFRPMTMEEKMASDDQANDAVRRAAEIFAEGKRIEPTDPVGKYLASRHLVIDGDRDLFLRSGPSNRPGQRSFLSALCDPLTLRDDEVRACGIITMPVHSDGRAATDARGKKLRGIVGRRRGLAVPLGFSDEPFDEGSTIGIGEGVETTIAGMELVGLRYALASGGSSTMPLINLPEWATSLIIFADNDAPGINAALDAGGFWKAEGRKVRIIKWGKDIDGTDAADALIEKLERTGAA